MTTPAPENLPAWTEIAHLHHELRLAPDFAIRARFQGGVWIGSCDRLALPSIELPNAMNAGEAKRAAFEAVYAQLAGWYEPAARLRAWTEAPCPQCGEPRAEHTDHEWQRCAEHKAAGIEHGSIHLTPHPDLYPPQ